MCVDRELHLHLCRVGECSIFFMCPVSPGDYWLCLANSRACNRSPQSKMNVCSGFQLFFTVSTNSQEKCKGHLLSLKMPFAFFLRIRGPRENRTAEGVGEPHSVPRGGGG
jgi:hypothetical protein